MPRSTFPSVTIASPAAAAAAASYQVPLAAGMPYQYPYGLVPSNQAEIDKKNTEIDGKNKEIESLTEAIAYC
jgi:hypothetical protein